MAWLQNYNPLNNAALSTLAALAPLIILLGCLGILKLKAHAAALAGLAATILAAILIYGMPAPSAAAATLYGMAYGLLPIGWIILNVLFLFNLTTRKGLLGTLQDSLTAITADRRLQLLLVAFCFGAFFEGAAGFGTPVAVTASILIGIGFPPLTASGLSLIANTAPVPYAGLGTPIIALQGVTGLDLRALTAQVAFQLVLFDLLIPAWILCILSGWKKMVEVLPAVLAAGGSFAVAQTLIAVFHGPWLVNIVSSIVSLVFLTIFLRWWKPRSIWRFEGDASVSINPLAEKKLSQAVVVKAWLPWVLLSVVVFVWGLPQVKTWLDGFTLTRLPVPGLDQMVLRAPPIVPQPRPEAAVFDFNWLSASGTGILAAALMAGLYLRYPLRQLLRIYWETLKQVRFTLLTIAATMAIGFVSRYAGLDGTLGLAFARTGWLYPFFGTLLGWLGVVLTGSDTSSNVLFGSLQSITAGQLGLNPVAMAAANSSGGVMGKMLNPQSISVASTATRWEGHEGEILRYVFLHSLALAALAGLVVLIQAYAH